MVKVRLNDETNVWLKLSTGNPGGIIVDRKVVEQTNWLKKYATLEKSNDTRDGIDSADAFILPTINFGPFTVDNVGAITPAIGEDFEQFKRDTSTGTHIPTFSRAAAGSIGYEVLKHFVITLDYKNGLIHVGTKASE